MRGFQEGCVRGCGFVGTRGLRVGDGVGGGRKVVVRINWWCWWRRVSGGGCGAFGWGGEGGLLLGRGGRGGGLCWGVEVVPLCCRDCCLEIQGGLGEDADDSKLMGESTAKKSGSASSNPRCRPMSLDSKSFRLFSFATSLSILTYSSFHRFLLARC